MDGKKIKLYELNGVESTFGLLIADDKYFIIKRVMDASTRYDERTKYRTIIIQNIENPFNIILNTPTDNNLHLYIDSADMSQLK